MNYQQRNALASNGKGPLPPVPILTGQPRAGGFATLEAQTMGNLGTPADGFDTLVTPLVAALPLHSAQLAEMDKHIAAATFTPGQVGAANYGPIGVAIIKLGPVGDALVSDYNGAVTAIAPPPQPGKGGGGGGGGGVGGTSCSIRLDKLGSPDEAVPRKKCVMHPPHQDEVTFFEGAMRLPWGLTLKPFRPTAPAPSKPVGPLLRK